MTMVLRSFSRPSEPVSDIRKVRRARTTWSNHAFRLAGIEKFHSGTSMTSRSVASSSAISCSEPARARTWFASRLSASVKLAPIQVRSGSATPVDTSRRIVVEVGSIRLAFAMRWSPSLRLSEFSPRGLVCTLRIFITLSICVWQVDDFVQATAVVSLCKRRDGEPFASVRRREIKRGTDGHDPARIDRAVALVIVPLEVFEIHGSGDAGPLVDVARVCRQIRIAGQPADVALEVPDIDRVEAD